MSLRRGGLGALAAATLLAGCVTPIVCPDGTVASPSGCVPEDAAADAPDGGGSDVPGGDAPCGGGCTAPDVCDYATNECVACLLASDCSTSGRGAACVERACVACDDNADCTEPGASVCGGDNTCGGCADDEGCEHLTATPTCDETAATCVECTSNADCTGANEGCNLETNTCETYVPGSGSLCGACIADAQCPEGQLCVAMQYDDPATVAADPVSAGSHCLWRSDASGPGAPGGDCFAVRPMVSFLSATSVDGVAADVCTLAVSTCEAHDDFRDTELPCTLDATGNALCGREGVPDGVCRSTGGPTNLCTVYCGSDTDCPSGFMCDTATTPRQCRL